MLTGYRVLDLTDHRGYLAGRVLADLGADVILVEPVRRDSAGLTGSFNYVKLHPELSAIWLAYNSGKRCVTLNLESNEGKDIFLRMATKADFVLESFSPGYMENIGLGHDVLREVKPEIIVTSISPFGQNGPYRKYKGPELVATAMSGFMFLTGYPDGPPLQVSFPLAYGLASIHAALASLIALYHRRRTGQGQHIDVAARESAICICGYALPTWDLNKVLIERSGNLWSRVNLQGEKITQKVLWSCKDGMIAFMVMGGDRGAKSNINLVKWMAEEGMADDFVLSVNWDSLDFASMISQNFQDRLSGVIEAFFMSHTKRELGEGAKKREILLQIVNAGADICIDQQLSHRNYWVEAPHPSSGKSVRFPGPFVKAFEKPLKQGARAPLRGEHNQEIFGLELGLSIEQMDDLKGRQII